MRIVDDVRRFDEPLPHLVLTIGSFDGVHLGHQRIIERVVEEARGHGGTAALMTLRPHPRQYFSPTTAPNILTSDSQREELFAALGIDLLFVLPFSGDVAHMDREDFVRQVILKRCHARKIIVGHDFNFGRGAQGNYEYLRELAPALNYEVEQVPALILDGERVSSTLVRELVMQGSMERAERFLGRRFAIRGTVIQGRGMGVKLGYPTANIDPQNRAMPAHGVYAAQAVVDGATYTAAVNIGIAPTIRHQNPMLEAYLLDFHENLVGKEIDVIFHKRLRPEKKFDSLEELIHAIGADVAEIRTYFALSSPS